MAEKQTCQPIDDDLFSAANRLQCEKYVTKMQRKLDQAVASGDKTKIRFLTHLMTRRSLAVKILSTYRITANKGSQTAGVDGVRIPKRTSKTSIRKRLLAEIDINRKPSPVRRTYIPKTNGKKRPLGIVTLRDRITQDVIKTAIEPIAEYHFSHQSFGFRPKRRAMDAIDKIFAKMARRDRPGWLIEGDIRSCFDEINHQHIENTMAQWNIPKSIRNITRRILTTRILDYGQYAKNPQGVQQGGPLSPLLANIALTALDNYCQSFGDEHKSVNPIVRYCDDFIIVCKSKEQAIHRKEKIRKFLHDNIGLQLSQEKTHITHVSQGFDFLGFHIRKYLKRSPKSKYHHKGIMLIKPQKQKMASMRRKCQQTLRKYYGKSFVAMVKALNPKIRGFCLYYRHVVSSKAFSHLDDWLWRRLLRWLKRQHHNKSLGWIRRKYLSYDRERFEENGAFNTRFMDIPIRRYISLKRGVRVYDASQQTIEFFKKRAYINALDQIHSIKVEKLFLRQKGICPTCEQPIEPEQIQTQQVHAHHVIPLTEDGDDKLSNLTLLHADCHRRLHSVFSLSEMARWYQKRLKYYGKRAVDEALA